jgi:hypothetical protein
LPIITINKDENEGQEAVNFIIQLEHRPSACPTYFKESCNAVRMKGRAVVIVIDLPQKRNPSASPTNLRQAAQGGIKGRGEQP